MTQDLNGRRVAFLVADEGVEQVELTEPWEAVETAGGLPHLISPSGGKVQAMNHLDKGDTFEAGFELSEIDPEGFDALVLPGGVANPDQLRTDQLAVDLVRQFVDSGRPVAVICHGPWTMVEAGVLQGRTLTSWPSVRTDIENAGGEWVDQPVVVCDNGPGPIISSRKPDDLPMFCEQLVESLSVES